MNIFVTDPCPTASAVALDNRRLVKMVLETAQLLSTTCRMMLLDSDINLDGRGIYKRTHFNHPCAIFARKSLPNFNWLVEHGLALSQEFQHRFCKVHASEAVIFETYKTVQDAVTHERGLAKGWRQTCNDLIFSFNCSGFNTGDLFRDYQLCMIKKWKSDNPQPKWSARKSPIWWSHQ